MLRTWAIQIPSCACCWTRPPGPDAGAPWGMRLSYPVCMTGGARAGVTHSYLTPQGHWHTIWRTLANPGE
ncbi:hypothetical protein GCM10018787_00520 [Streptomyces thermodiastaticus]|nr:hypothetical protein GCM10018787_00520 [Streptomyces thermodiastaticus]